MLACALFVLSVVGVAADPHFCSPTPEHNSDILACVAKEVSFDVRVCDVQAGDYIQFSGDISEDADYTDAEGTDSAGEFYVETSFSIERVPSSMSDSQICFQGMRDGGDSGETGALTLTNCVNLIIRYAPEFIPPTPLPSFENEEASSNAKICEPLEFELRASDMNPEDDVTIFVMEDPGLPNGAIVSSNVCPGATPNLEGDLVKRPCNAVSRTFTWTPAKGQEGKTYRVCFVARDNKNNCQLGGRYSLLVHGQDLCVQINVVKPAPRWLSPTPTHMNGLVVNDPSSTDFQDDRKGLARLAHVGCATTFTLIASDDNYCVNIKTSTANPLPPGADELACTAIGIGGEATPTTVERCTTDLTLSCHFSWRPQRGSEGQTHVVCFDATDNICTRVLHDGNLQSDLPEVSHASAVEDEPNVPLCIPLYVARCRYCARKGDTLHYITKHYHIDTHWLRLWNTNGNDDRLEGHHLDTDPDITTTIHDPDNILHDDDVINVGPIYKVQVGDTLVQLADRFHTTVKKIMSVNPDVGASGDSEEKIQAGQELCILLCTDALDINQMTYKYAY